MSFAIRAFRANDSTSMEAARHIREIVFCREQGVPPEIEWDGEDQLCEHFLLESGGEPIGTARLRIYEPSVFKVERVAVLKQARGLGAGKAIMVYILDRLKNSETIVLNAQTQVEEFYERLGFARNGDEFEEAGIAHVPMAWRP
jgi:predicted GNAT family N-acyltransferase